MNILLTITRWIVGLLFIFSGLVKANDPLGLSYKMQEFFEAWGWTGLHDYTLAMSILMNAFEIIAGVAVIVGWRMKLFSWLLLLLILFFTFLTGYASLATNADGILKFRSCGCFGDCLPLSPNQSFLKDIILLVLILFIFKYRKEIKPLFRWNFLNVLKVTASAIFAFALQWYVLKYLPVVDCLPFKKGNNLIVNRNMPPGAIPDKYEYRFIYEKNGDKKEFPLTALPDSTWKFADRKQVLVQKGKNNEPKIKDFTLQTIGGEDLTETILNTRGGYYLLFIQNANGLKATDEWIAKASAIAAKNKLYIVTGQYDAVKALLKNDAVLSQMALLVCDVTAIKTAARAVPTMYKMNGPIVDGKWSGASFGKVD
ncbi:MAG: DoxX family protein [Chitinophagaceae bacterium]|nr:DoxX family protein [Chitinophagaceae bacterium]